MYLKYTRAKCVPNAEKPHRQTDFMTSDTPKHTGTRSMEKADDTLKTRTYSNKGNSKIEDDHGQWS